MPPREFRSSVALVDCWRNNRLAEALYRTDGYSVEMASLPRPVNISPAQYKVMALVFRPSGDFLGGGLKIRAKLVTLVR
jgi:hypothetical protein